MTDLAAKAYVVLEPQFDDYGILTGMRIDRVTQRRPSALSNGEMCFPLNVMVPKSVFEPLPGVSIQVPEGEIIAPKVTLE